MNLELERAKSALAAIQVELHQPNGYGNYRSYCEGLPATVLMNGLGQALAMLLAKVDKHPEKKRFYEAISHWVTERVWGSSVPQLLERIVNSDQNKYVQAHAETLAYLGWLKKFSAAYLEKREEED